MLTKDVKQGSRTDLAEEDLGQLADVAERSVRRARFVLRHDRPLAQSVMNGAESLNAAYESAKTSATAKDRAAEADLPEDDLGKLAEVSGATTLAPPLCVSLSPWRR
jgi:hypothetical protein